MKCVKLIVITFISVFFVSVLYSLRSEKDYSTIESTLLGVFAIPVLSTIFVYFVFPSGIESDGGSGKKYGIFLVGCIIFAIVMTEVVQRYIDPLFR